MLHTSDRGARLLLYVCGSDVATRPGKEEDVEGGGGGGEGGGMFAPGCPRFPGRGEEGGGCSASREGEVTAALVERIPGTR